MSSETGLSIADFVLIEAAEKCFENEVIGLKQYEKERDHHVSVGKENVDESFQQQSKQIEQKFRIEKSTAINSSRQEKMETRNYSIQKVFQETQFQIYKKCQNDKNFYKELLQKLLIQGLIRIYEKKVIIKCLEKDVSVIKSIVKEAKQQFEKIIKSELDVDFSVNIEVSNYYLNERKVEDSSQISISDYNDKTGNVIEKHQELRSCFGGILIQNEAGNIVVKNTLDVRTDLSFQESIPDIREIMFPRK